MIDIESYSEMHIRNLQNISKRDPILIERTIYAFGLLEALIRVGLPFIFKGGTCLMLLMDHPKRLSTDIDIVVEPGIDLDYFLDKASKIFPFIEMDEQKRIGKNSIVKRHFKFVYNSPVNKKNFYILLDVLFEENHYSEIITKKIKNDLLIHKPEYYLVNVPSSNCILSDKLTAFAPHTIGIPLNNGKDMEVIKQFYDVSSLIDIYDESKDMMVTYEQIALTEIGYRGIDVSIQECLIDTYKTAYCIASRGKINAKEYPLIVKGIHDLRGHIYSDKFTPEIAAFEATKVMYFTLCLICGIKYIPVVNENEYINCNLVTKDMQVLKSLRKMNTKAYAYVVKIDEILSKLNNLNYSKASYPSYDI